MSKLLLLTLLLLLTTFSFAFRIKDLDADLRLKDCPKTDAKSINSFVGLNMFPTSPAA